MPDPIITDVQAEFVRRYIVHKNGTKAAIEAGLSPKSACNMANKYLDGKTYPEVYRAVRIALQRLELRADKKAEDVLRYIHTAMFFEPMKFFSPGDDGGWLLSEDQYINLPPEIGCLIEKVELQRVIVTKPDGSRVEQLRYWVELVSKTAMTKLAAQCQILAKGANEKESGPRPLPWDDLYTRRRVENDPIEARINEVKVIESKPAPRQPNPIADILNGGPSKN